MKQSYSKKKNPYLLQEEEEQVSEEANYDAAVNTEKIKYMITRIAWLVQYRERRIILNIKKQ